MNTKSFISDACKKQDNKEKKYKICSKILQLWNIDKSTIHMTYRDLQNDNSLYTYTEKKKSE